mmetsp:Transcript_8844/g.28028  ORF Transcript_8844/g.28028 Transcript_8844/m.28028 type:complete len:240 (-) Transcript_8844:1156-1875(-)
MARRPPRPTTAGRRARSAPTSSSCGLTRRGTSEPTPLRVPTSSAPTTPAGTRPPTPSSPPWGVRPSSRRRAHRSTGAPRSASRCSTATCTRPARTRRRYRWPSPPSRATLICASRARRARWRSCRSSLARPTWLCARRPRRRPRRSAPPSRSTAPGTASSTAPTRSPCGTTSPRAGRAGTTPLSSPTTPRPSSPSPRAWWTARLSRSSRTSRPLAARRRAGGRTTRSTWATTRAAPSRR